MSAVNVLLVEDDKSTRERLSSIIEEAEGVELSNAVATLGDAKASLGQRVVD